MDFETQPSIFQAYARQLFDYLLANGVAISWPDFMAQFSGFSA